jgi:hypothetical protein
VIFIPAVLFKALRFCFVSLQRKECAFVGVSVVYREAVPYLLNTKGKYISTNTNAKMLMD